MAYKADLPEEDDVDAFWAAMFEVREIGLSAPAYSKLLPLVRALLFLQASNADSERCSFYG